MAELSMTRMGMIMEPLAGEPNEVEGVLNPAAIRGHDGQLYLFPRLVARGNFSRIGIARVLFDGNGDPTGVERMGIALAPEAEYELNATGGGCEDPRISYVEPLGHYVMTYTAFSRNGPRIAIAISEDLRSWRRLGLARFSPHHHVSFAGVDDKDAGIFPTLVPDPSGRPAIALVHRPLFPGTCPEEKIHHPKSGPMDTDHESIWISYSHISSKAEPHHICEFVAHHRLACPVGAWEHLKIGGGAPAILCRHGWLLVYHGVENLELAGGGTRKLRYSAGAMILSHTQPSAIIYRSSQAILTPGNDFEYHGTVENVVFPTGIDRRDDLGTPDRFDVYYGMADDRIGVARLDVPAVLSESSSVTF